MQKKYISELGSKEIVRTMVLGSERRFRSLMASNVSVWAEFVKEPLKIAKERENLLVRKQVLEEALKQVVSLPGK